MLSASPMPAKPPISADPPTAPESAALAKPSPKRLGRPPGTGKLTPQVKETILESLAAGMPLPRAALRAGISERSLQTWRQKNPQFLEECKKAEADAEYSLLSSIKSKGEGGNKLWTADAWLLERRFGYHPVSRSELTGRDGGPIQHLTIAKQLLIRAGSRGDKVVTPINV